MATSLMILKQSPAFLCVNKDLKPEQCAFYAKKRSIKKSIKQQDLTNEFFTPEKCYITELSNTANDPAGSTLGVPIFYHYDVPSYAEMIGN